MTKEQVDNLINIIMASDALVSDEDLNQLRKLALIGANLVEHIKDAEFVKETA